MLPGPDLVLACPSCGTLVRSRTLASGNTFGATLWSDGYFDAPMLPQEPALTRCPAGDHWFWLEDAAEVGRDDWFGAPWDAPDAGSAAPYAGDLSDADYAAALDAGLGATPDREAHLRLRLWWTANDAVRGTDAAPEPDRDNLERLQTLQLEVPPNALSVDDEWDGEDDPDVDAADEDESEDEVDTERGEPVLRAAVAHALGQPDLARHELAAARLPPEWAQSFAVVIASGTRRLVALA